ncbi:MarR family winged helix-turn-helix transcriptional regulator [Clostridium scatologenes]|uniref:MarR family transcriptional regulator n=1 Tax=Clostridium scatologenes TaxID=1548 RepID=A0A0E3K0S8_CLOSL|nr:MarR family winged helix-turn-helix transcriptional regulator [Clostridium scatologenes]AKA69289.1 MarR family transcriptional regulator [Clostridium scatologenes]
MKQNEILEKIICFSNKVNQNNKKPNNYGTEHTLYSAEIHMIEAIGNHKNANASELSIIMGITNGAINQVANKLIKKGLVEQYRMKDNKKDVFYQLTTQGKIANIGHSNYHKEQYSHMEEYIDELVPEEINVINKFLDELIKSWPSK